MNASDQVHLTVDLTYACNYKCPYCILPPVTKHREVREWVEAFERIRARHPQMNVTFSGGEPSIYPGFFELVRTTAGPFHVGM